MRQISVAIADYAVGRAGLTLITIGLGSCVGIALYAPDVRVGALAHVLLPNVNLSTAHNVPGKYASTAVPAMVRRIRELGARGPIEARLVGGASMFAPLLPSGSMSLGSRNVTAARAACAEAQVSIVAEAVGGSYGRSVYFDLAAGQVLVRSIRKDDVSL